MSEKKVKFRPIGDRILIRRKDPDERSRGGIIIPDISKEKPAEGEVMAVGSGKVLEDGRRVEPEVKVGDMVLFGKYSGTEVKVNGEPRIIMDEGSIIGIIEEA